MSHLDEQINLIEQKSDLRLDGALKQIDKTYEDTRKDMSKYLGNLYTKYENNNTLSYMDLARYEGIKELEDKLKGITVSAYDKLASDMVKNLKKAYHTAYTRTSYGLEMASGLDLGYKPVLNGNVMQKIQKKLGERKQTLSNRLTYKRSNFYITARTDIVAGALNHSDYQSVGLKVQGHLEDDNKAVGRIMANEVHRIVEEAKYDSVMHAQSKGLKCLKTWVTVKDNKVRETHRELEGVTIRADELFTLTNGIKTTAPSQSEVVSEYMNCRCKLVYTLDPTETKLSEITEEKPFEEWAQEHGMLTGDEEDVKKADDQNGPKVDPEVSKVLNREKDNREYLQYKALFKETNFGISFEEFQDMKYTRFEEYYDLKRKYRFINNYKVDYGEVSIEKLMELHDATYETKMNGFDIFVGKNKKEKSQIKATRQNGNAAMLDINGNKYFAHSKASENSDLEYISYIGDYPLIGLKNDEDRHYRTIDFNRSGNSRKADTEAKFFEYLRDILPEDSHEEVTILSERDMCLSCRGVLRQFQTEFPDVKVNMVSGLDSKKWISQEQINKKKDAAVKHN